ncbi:MAG: hypothetical protein QF483_02325, partial [Gammaproteobacteria bacterium]|nr:hypothetical protein [Gammaproteobacteria bacterium]
AGRLPASEREKPLPHRVNYRQAIRLAGFGVEFGNQCRVAALFNLVLMPGAGHYSASSGW